MCHVTVFNQLKLFKDLDVKAFDENLTELYRFIYSMKYYTLLVELSEGRESERFETAYDTVGALVSLCNALSKYSLKYGETDLLYWEKAGNYDPYYPAIEPKSKEELIRIAQDYFLQITTSLIKVTNLLKIAAVSIPDEIEDVKHNIQLLRKDIYEIY